MLTKAGLGSQVRAFELSMNRAAERAAPQAKRIFWDAIKQIRFSDAKRILNGADNEATLKALDGLFLILAEEEKRIRQDPAARVTDILKKVFGKN